MSYLENRPVVRVRLSPFQAATNASSQVVEFPGHHIETVWIPYHFVLASEWLQDDAPVVSPTPRAPCDLC
jgi:hypothetical protein